MLLCYQRQGGEETTKLGRCLLIALLFDLPTPCVSENGLACFAIVLLLGVEFTAVKPENRYPLSTLSVSNFVSRRAYSCWCPPPHLLSSPLSLR